MKLVKSDSYLKKHKDVFNRIEPDIEFEFKGFKYTFSPMIPSPHAALDFNSSLFDGLYSNEKRKRKKAN